MRVVLHASHVSDVHNSSESNESVLTFDHDCDFEHKFSLWTQEACFRNKPASWLTPELFDQLWQSQPLPFLFGMFGLNQHPLLNQAGNCALY